MKVHHQRLALCAAVVVLGTAAAGQLSAQASNAPVITTGQALPDGIIGQPYSQRFAATGGTAPYRWGSPALPPGTALDPVTGTLSGTVNITGTFTFTVQVTDASQQASQKTFTLAIKIPRLAITTVPPLFSGTVGQPYAQTFTASGGVPPYRWSMTSGQTATLTLDTVSGALQGTPDHAGSFTFTVQVADSVRSTISQTFTVVVNAPTVTITTAATLPAATVAASYSVTLGATGATAPYTWSLTAGAIPGLTLSAAGMLAGTPTKAGSFSIAVQATDASGLTATKSLTLTVNPGLLQLISGAQLPPATVGTPYSQTVAASGGVLPYTWSANGLPDGLVIETSSGAIAGTPTVAGSFPITIRVTDHSLATAVNLFRMTVSLPAAPSVTISGLPATVQPADQPNGLQISLDAPYPAVLSGTVSLTFAPDTGAGDATIKFSNGGMAAAFKILAGQTTATFQDVNLAFQTGTVAGTLTFSVTQLQSSGADVPLGSVPALSVRVERAAPAIKDAKIVRTANGFNIEITGFCTAREVTQATFTFSVAPGKTLQTSQLSVTVDTLFSQWFQDPASSQYGTQFVLTQPFTVQGDATAVTPNAVTLTNRVGSATAQVRP